MDRTPPCKDCPRRKVKCHATCPDYKNWKMDWDAYRDKVKLERRRNAVIRHYYNKK